MITSDKPPLQEREQRNPREEYKDFFSSMCGVKKIIVLLSSHWWLHNFCTEGGSKEFMWKCAYSLRLRRHLISIQRLGKSMDINTWKILLPCKYQQVIFTTSRLFTFCFYHWIEYKYPQERKTNINAFNQMLHLWKFHLQIE